MASQTDLDQGGTFRGWVRQYMGPSIGWVYAPGENVQAISVAGTFTIARSVNLIQVNVAGAVIIKLPSAILPAVGAGALPGLFANNPITIVDVGGNALAHPITIQPFSGSQNIMGLTSVSITVNYGGYTLQPISALSGWVQNTP